MTQFNITYGVGGGYNDMATEMIEADSLDSANRIAYESAVEVFESYGIFDSQNPDYDYDSEDYQEDYQEEVESWIDYSAEEVN